MRRRQGPNGIIGALLLGIAGVAQETISKATRSRRDTCIRKTWTINAVLADIYTEAKRRLDAAGESPAPVH